MPVFVLLLRAVNVGGTGKLPMSDLKALCEKARFRNVRTYIASGNVVAERDGAEAEAKAALEVELRSYAGKPVGVIVRTAAEMATVAANNPFPDRAANRTVAIFLDPPPPADALSRSKAKRTRSFAWARARSMSTIPTGSAAPSCASLLRTTGPPAI